MTLVLRHHASPFVSQWDQDRFWTVLHDEVPVGVLVATRGRSDGSSRWDWTLQLHAGPFYVGSVTATFGSAETREFAAAAIRSAFDAAFAAMGVRRLHGDAQCHDPEAGLFAMASGRLMAISESRPGI